MLEAVSERKPISPEKIPIKNMAVNILHSIDIKIGIFLSVNKISRINKHDKTIVTSP